MLIGATLLTMTGVASAEEVCWEEVAPGVDWCVFGEGNLQSEIHWATVDLTVPEVYIRVTRDDEGPVTTSQEAANKATSVTINGDWDSSSYDGPHGLSVGNAWPFDGSQDWDSNNPAGDWSFLACNAKKECRMNSVDVLEQWAWNEINVIGGNGQRLVIDGVLQYPNYDTCTRPRSGVCLDITGEVMTFFVAEGDNSCSSANGWTPADFAQFVFEHGCYNGLMLDGGGSSDLVINQVHVTDRPPEEPAERSTHNHLSVVHYPNPPDPQCATLMNGRRCDGDTLVTCQGGYADPGDCTVFGSVCEEGSGTAYCVFEPYCPNGANNDACIDATVMNRCSLGQPTEFDCANLFGASCEDFDGGARCIQYGCIYGGDTSWCDGDVAKTCAPDDSGDLVVSFLTEVDCAASGQACQDGGCTIVDEDGDGYASTTNGGDDCDDTNAEINPGAVELCNELDDDCDSQTDEDAPAAPTWFLDLDGDGYGEPQSKVLACDQPPAYVDNGLDCNDTDYETNPGKDETCNLSDDDCDGEIDENATNTKTFYLDIDGDGYGNPNESKEDCFGDDAWVTDNTDCNDTDGGTHPGAEDIPDDGIDQDCDGIYATSNTEADASPEPEPDTETEPVEDVGPEPENDTAPPTGEDTEEPDIEIDPEEDTGPTPTEDTGTPVEPDTTGSAQPDSTSPPVDEPEEDGSAADTQNSTSPPDSAALPGIEAETPQKEADGCQSTPGHRSPVLPLLLFVCVATLRWRRDFVLN